MTIRGKISGLLGKRAGMAVLAILSGLAANPAAAQLNIAVEARVTLLARAYNATGQQLFGQFRPRRAMWYFRPIRSAPL